MPGWWMGATSMGRCICRAHLCMLLPSCMCMCVLVLLGTGCVCPEPVVNLVTPNTSATPMEFLGKLAWAWKSYPPSQVSPYLVDYGADKRDFLEVLGSFACLLARLLACCSPSIPRILLCLRFLPSSPSMYRSK